MRLSFVKSICLVLLTNSFAFSQTQLKAQFTEDFWDIKAENFAFSNYKGKPSLYLEKGAAILKDAKLKNGIIEYDVNFSQGRKFAMIQFRHCDDKNYEEFYLRAHQSGNPDAMQYTPVFNGVSGWQLYHGKGYSGAYHYNFEEWMHVKLVIYNNKMDVFLNNMSQPVLHVHDLKREPVSGGLGFYSLLGGAHYANLTYQEIEEPKLIGVSRATPELEEGVLLDWEVSKFFDKKDLNGVVNLKRHSEYASGEWSPLATEYDGKLNLAKVGMKTKEKNTVFAKTIIPSEKRQIKKLSFGFSDDVIIYVNNKVVYSGYNRFRSRDYRYLGTIGYFDSIYLTLTKGKNEVVFAVSETMGGWGLKAKIKDIETSNLD